MTTEVVLAMPDLAPDQIRKLVARLDTPSWSDIEESWSRLRPLEEAVVPYLGEAYPRTRRWQGRKTLVFHSMRYARVSEAAFELGLAALDDRSFEVRYVACGLLAYSLRDDALEPLRRTEKHDDVRTREDAAAAMRAIQERNHHLFRDRTGSGVIKWALNPEDRAG